METPWTEFSIQKGVDQGKIMVNQQRIAKGNAASALAFAADFGFLIRGIMRARIDRPAAVLTLTDITVSTFIPRFAEETSDGRVFP
jgi:hypothetical protein